MVIEGKSWLWPRCWIRGHPGYRREAGRDPSSGLWSRGAGGPGDRGAAARRDPPEPQCPLLAGGQRNAGVRPAAPAQPRAGGQRTRATGLPPWGVPGQDCGPDSEWWLSDGWEVSTDGGFRGRLVHTPNPLLQGLLGICSESPCSFIFYICGIYLGKKKTQSVHLHKEVTYPYVLAILHYMYITHICNLFL